MRFLRTILIKIAACVAVLVAAGCSPAIGDSCSTSFDCSINGDRTCDLARPSGACTIFGCEADSCPDDAVCVEFRPEPSRLSFTACMRKCETNNNCRIDEGFICMAANEVVEPGPSGAVIARVIDEMRIDTGRFCVATEPAPEGDM